MRPESLAALAAVDVALPLIRTRQGAARHVPKGERDLATGTDVAVEDAIRAVLAGASPGVGVAGEERGGVEIREGRYWLLDPICGTRNFASDIPVHAVDLALVEDGAVALAVVADGGTGRRYVAERGRGAWVVTAEGTERISTERISTSDASVTVNVDVGSAELGPHVSRASRFASEAIAGNRWFIRMFGSSLVFAYVATGRVSAHIVFSSSAIHSAAGCLLVEEAGGTVTDVDGRAWGIDSGSFLAAATPRLHAELLGIARRTRL